MPYTVMTHFFANLFRVGIKGLSRHPAPDLQVYTHSSGGFFSTALAFGIPLCAKQTSETYGLDILFN